MSLNLETIQMTDAIRTGLKDKINNNMQKIDIAFGNLKDKLLENTGQETLEEAVAYVENMSAQISNLNNEITALNTRGNAVASDIRSGKNALSGGSLINGTLIPLDTSDANAIPEDIRTSKTAYVNGIKITGSAVVTPTINVTLTGNSTYMGYISGYGAGIDKNGNLIIWAMSNTTSYEHILFVNTSIAVGTIGAGWNISSFDTSDPANVPHACVVTGLSNYNTINIELNADYVYSSYDYVRLNVTLTAE